MSFDISWRTVAVDEMSCWRIVGWRIVIVWRTVAVGESTHPPKIPGTIFLDEQQGMILETSAKMIFYV